MHLNTYHLLRPFRAIFTFFLRFTGEPTTEQKLSDLLLALRSIEELFTILATEQSKLGSLVTTGLPVVPDEFPHTQNRTRSIASAEDLINRALAMLQNIKSIPETDEVALECLEVLVSLTTLSQKLQVQEVASRLNVISERLAA